MPLEVMIFTLVLAIAVALMIAFGFERLAAGCGLTAVIGAVAYRALNGGSFIDIAINLSIGGALLLLVTWGVIKARDLVDKPNSTTNGK